MGVQQKGFLRELVMFPLAWRPYTSQALDMSSMVDGSKVRIFGTKRAAQDGARAIGWPVSCVSAVHTRFQACWALGTGIDVDPNTGLPWLSRERFGELFHARNGRTAAP